jgi:hypothetical protein
MEAVNVVKGLNCKTRLAPRYAEMESCSHWLAMTATTSTAMAALQIVTCRINTAATTGLLPLPRSAPTLADTSP